MTTGPLSINNGSTANADLFLTQLGGGFSMGERTPEDPRPQVLQPG